MGTPVVLLLNGTMFYAFLHSCRQADEREKLEGAVSREWLSGRSLGLIE